MGSKSLNTTGNPLPHKKKQAEKDKRRDPESLSSERQFGLVNPFYYYYYYYYCYYHYVRSMALDKNGELCNVFDDDLAVLH